MLHFHKKLIFVVVVLVLVAVAPSVAAQMTPSVTVSDQAIANGTVTVASVDSDGPGWIVIHTQQDGAPGPIIGHAPVSDGSNSDVVVEVDAAAATDTLFAMLHTDAGTVGTYEFPGDDVPVKVNDQVVTPPFNVTNGVGVVDQPIVDGTVTVARVFSEGAGWIVIHTQQDGAPGPIIGHAPVSAGMNTDVAVQIDASAATDVLYAMLHTDAGTVGTYEFPGDDVPVKAGDQVITPSFNVSPGTLPETGGTTFPWAMWLLLVTGGLALASGVALIFIRRLHKA
jgi:hypothetical protein